MLTETIMQIAAETALLGLTDFSYSFLKGTGDFFVPLRPRPGGVHQACQTADKDAFDQEERDSEDLPPSPAVLGKEERTHRRRQHRRQ